MYNNSFQLVLSVCVDNVEINYLINFEEDTAIRLEESNGSRSFRWLAIDEVGDYWRTDLLEDFEEGRDFARVLGDVVIDDLTDNYGDIEECAQKIEAIKESLEF